MKFRFEDDEKQQINQSNTRISQQSQITFQNVSSSLMNKSLFEIKLSSFQKSGQQVKQQLIQAVNLFKQDIDKEIKIQKLLKKEIQMLSQQSFKRKELLDKKLAKQQVKTQVKYAESQKVDQIENVKYQSSNALEDKIKSSQKPNKKLINTRSIKSELLSKGYPVSAKIQTSKNSLPYRFRSN